MNWSDLFFWRRKESKSEAKSDKLELAIAREDVPLKAGRSSVSEYSGVNRYVGDFGNIKPEFRLELLELLQELAIWNGDFSNAIENIVRLANRPHIVSFSEDTDVNMIEKAQAYLTKVERSWYRGGIHALKTDLLTQLAIFGAISAETVIRRDLKGVEKVCLVPHKRIKFKYNSKLDDFVAYQDYNGERKLNPFTYKYYSLTRINENPYAIPPMLSALRDIDTDNFLVDNLKYVAKKHGVLGFLSVLVSKPQIRQGESEAQYWLRCEEYLRKLKPEIEEGYRNGIALGFKDKHEIKIQSSTSEGSAARDIIELNDLKKMSGMKQDPIFFGRPFNTSEAIGRVIFEKWTGQLEAYQNSMVAFLEDLYLKELVMAGFPVSELTIEFEKPNTKDKLRDAQATLHKINNIIKLRDEGIISQQQAAKELNYDKPFAEGRISDGKDININQKIVE